MASYGREYLFGQLGLVVPAVSPPNHSSILSLLAFDGKGWRGSLDVLQALLSNSQNFGLLSAPP